MRPHHRHAVRMLFAAILLFACPFSVLLAQTSFDSLAKSATAAREAGNLPQALHDYQAALQLHPDWQEGWWYLGTMQYDVDNYAAAVPALQKLLALDPQNLAAAAFLGLSEFQTKSYDAAYSHLQQAQTLPAADDPELYRVAHYHFALLQIRSGNFAEAMNVLAAETSTQNSQQINFALGLASLRVPLLPAEVDPSRESLLQNAGEAISALNHKEIGRAIDMYARLLQDHPDLPYLNYAYGLALDSDGKLEEALIVLQKETQVSPQSPLPFLAISRIEEKLGHAEKARQAADTAGQLSQKSEPREQRILALYSNSRGSGAAPETSDLWNKAMRAYSGNQYAQAASDLKTFVATNPQNGTAWAVLGLSEFALKEYDNALLHLRRGNELGIGASSDSVQLAKYTLAVLYNRNGQHELAARLLSDETGAGAHAAKVQFALGMATLRLAGLPEQFTAQRSLVSSTGEIALLLQQSKYDQALPKLQSLLKENPSTPFLHYTYGVALASLSEYPEAEAQFREEARISQQSELPQIRLASIALRARRPSDAVNPAKGALEIAPNSAEAHYLLGRAYLDLGQTPEAVRELETAAVLEPGSPEIHFNLAKAYAKAQQPEKAEQERATFTRLNALAEKQKSLRGNQSYGGSHDSSDVSLSATPNAASTQQEKQ